MATEHEEKVQLHTFLTQKNVKECVWKYHLIFSDLKKKNHITHDWLRPHWYDCLGIAKNKKGKETHNLQKTNKQTMH